MNWILLLFGFYFVIANTQNIERFPIEKVYNFSMIDQPDLYFRINDKHLCLNKTEDKKKCCSCLPECVKYHVCCIDYFWYDRRFGNIEDYYNYFIAKMRDKKPTTCSPFITNINNDIKNVNYIRMVTKCKNSQKIESNLDYPVKDETGYVYQNKDIAKCNQVNKTSPVNIQAICSDNPFNGNSSSCIFEIVENNDMLLKCNPNRQSYGNDLATNESSIDETMCKLYSGRIETNEKTYTNIHCYKTKQIKNIWVIPESCLSLVSPETVHNMPYSITISFTNNLQVIFKNKNKIYEIINCKNDELYDFLLLKCIKFICADGYIKYGRACVLDVNQTSGSITIEKADNKEKKLKKCFLKQSSREREYQVRALLHLDTRKNFTSNMLKVNEITNISNNTILATYQLQNLNQFENLILRIQNLTQFIHKAYLSAQEFKPLVIHHLNVHAHFPRSRKCFKSEMIHLNNIRIDSNCTLYVNEKNVYHVDNFVIVFLFNKKTERLEPKLYICKQFHLEPNCPLRIIPKHDYKIKNNFEIKVKTEEKVFRISEYIPMENSVAVCIKENTAPSKNQKDWLIKANRIESYLTIASAFISIISYLITIIIYLYIKDLRIVSGLNIVTLCSFLLISDILLLSINAVQSNTACKNIAITLHWALMGVLLSTLVISFEIFITFRGTIRSRGDTLKRYLYYVLVITLSSSLFIILPYILDNHNIFSMAYGRDDICWISSLNGRIIFYIVPWCIIMFISLCIVIYVLKTIYKQEKVSKRLLNKAQDNHDLSIVKTALKLIVLLGVIEIIGLIQLPQTNTMNTIVNVIFRYIFTLFRGFRGVFILFMYVYSNKRIEEKFSCNKTRQQMEDSPTLTRTSRVSTKSNVITKQNTIALKSIKINA